MVLEEGKIYSLKDLSEWFGYGPRYLHKATTRDKKLTELKEYYADYELIGKKIKVFNIRQDTYEKRSKREKNDQFYQEAIVKLINEAPLQYYKTAAGRITQSHKEKLEAMHHNSFETAYTYTRRNMKKMFVTEQTHGHVSDKVWCQRFFGADYDFKPIPDKQLKVWKELLEKYLQDKEYTEELAAILSLKENGELTTKEANERTFELMSTQWDHIKAEFCEQFGFVPVAVPRYELDAVKLKILKDMARSEDLEQQE